MATVHKHPHPPPTPPVTAHTLRPHHVQLLGTMWILFNPDKPLVELPKDFELGLYRVLINEISECRQPASFAQLIEMFRRNPHAYDPLPQVCLAEIQIWPRGIHSPERLGMFMAVISRTMADREDDDSFRFARRSLFGYFMRRCIVSFNKLSFEAVTALWGEFQVWTRGELLDIEYHIRKDILSNSHSLYKTDADKKEYAQPYDYKEWEAALAMGEGALAPEHLRRFFEQRFHDQNDSGLRQHALLNLARMHWVRHEFVACRKLLQEAITTSRTSNDRQTLQHCIGLMNRLPTTERGKRPPINDIQPDLHPLEVLHDAKKYLMVVNQQPVSAAFERIAQAASLWDTWSDTQSYAVEDAEVWDQHAVQSVAWQIMGNIQLANIEDLMVMAFTDPGSENNSRLTATVNTAYRRARQGNYEDAIASLLEPEVWAGLSNADCHTWANEIWHILVLRASRRGQERMYHDTLLPRRPPGPYHPREYWYSYTNPLNSHIRDPLIDVITAREMKQAHNNIEPLLTALWHAEFQQRFGLCRTTLTLLADVGLEYGMTKWCRRVVEEMMPQVINGDDKEQRGFMCFTLARCMIAAEDATPDALRECIRYLEIAEQDYETLEMYRSLQDVQYLLSVVYHNLGMTEQRNKAAERHKEVGKQREEAEKEISEPWIDEVLDVVSEVSAALSARSY